jgi:hypothetical protein
MVVAVVFAEGKIYRLPHRVGSSFQITDIPSLIIVVPLGGMGWHFLWFGVGGQV